MATFRLKPWQPKETLVVSSILQALFYEIQAGRVVWAKRMNSGATKYQDKEGKQRFVRYGFPGCPDIHGMMHDGRALYLEVKTATGKVTHLQSAFLEKVLAHGAVGGIVRSPEEAIELIRNAGYTAYGAIDGLTKEKIGR